MIQSSTKYENSTLPTILDDSSTFHQQVSKLRPYLSSQITKIRQLDTILHRSMDEKNSLLKQQEQLKRVLQERLNIIEIMLKDNQKQVQQQQDQLNQDSQKKQITNEIKQISQRTSYFEFSTENTSRKFYTAMNTPKLHFSDKSNTLQNSREFRTSMHKKTIKKSAFDIKQSSSPLTLQKCAKTSNLNNQNFRQPLNKYPTIEEIWNEYVPTYPKKMQAIIQHSYL